MKIRKFSLPAYVLILILITSLPGILLFSDTPDELPDSGNTPRIALVLGGGGALGFAHVGVLLAMEEAGVDPDMVVGTSIGSIVGGLYSAGYSPEEMKNLVLESDWQEILFDNYSRDKMVFEQRLLRTTFPVVLPFYKNNDVTDVGISHAQHVLEFLDSLLDAYPAEMDFDTLPRSFRAVSTDLLTGEKIVFDYGDLKTVIRASMAVPGIFTPVHYRNRYLIDGGWVDNVPAITAVEMGADIIITVPLGSLQPEAEKLTTLGAISQQATELLLSDAYGSDEDISDLVIRPALSGYTMADFDKGAELIEIGYAAGKAAFSNLKEIAALQKNKHQQTREPQQQNVSLNINRITLSDSDPYRKEILEQLDETVPREVSNSQLREIFSEMYDSGRFKRCSYRLLPDSSGGYTLEADIASIQLPDTLIGFGVEYTGYFSGSTLHRGMLKAALIKPFGKERVSGLVTFISVSNTGSIRTGYMTTNQNSLLASAFGYLEQEPVYYYEGNTLDSFYSLTRAGGDMLLTIAPSVYFHMTLQPYAEYCYFSRLLGETVLPEEGWSRAGSRTSFTVDTLNNPVIPESGISLRVENDTAVEDSRLLSSLSWNGNGFLPILPGLILASRGDGGINLADSPKEAEYFFLGKNMSFHGYLPGEIEAGAYATAALNIRRQIGRLPLLLGREIFVQVTANAAAVQPPGMELSRTKPDWYYGGSTGFIANFPVGELSLRFELNDKLRPGIFLGLSSGAAPGFN